MEDRNLLAQIDACRPGTDDVQEPELAPLAERLTSDDRVAELYRQVQAADAAIAAALRDVPVPEGLEDRLLVALKAARLGDLQRPEFNETISDDKQQATVAAPASATLPRRTFSAWRIAAAVCVAAACLALLAVYFQRPANVSAEEIVANVNEVYDEQVAASDAQWTQTSADDPAFPLPNILNPSYSTVYGSRPLAVGGYPAMAYDLLGPLPPNLSPQVLQQIPKRVTLLVIKRRVTGLAYVPPPEPQNTQGRYVGVWQSDRFVYALVVEGSEDQYLHVRGHIPVA